MAQNCIHRSLRKRYPIPSVFLFGSTDIHDIALGLKIPLQNRENKSERAEGIYSKRNLKKLLKRAFMIFELIDSHLKKIGRSGLLPAGVVYWRWGSMQQLKTLQSSSQTPSSIAHPALANAGKHLVKDHPGLLHMPCCFCASTAVDTIDRFLEF